MLSRLLNRIDWRILFVILALMIISLLTISSADPSAALGKGSFFSPKAKSQLNHFFVGFIVFFFFASFDYRKLRRIGWLLYCGMVLTLLGLFFTEAVQNVHRWYRLPLIGASLQPSECAKLILIIQLANFLERNSPSSQSLRTSFIAMLIVGIPFLLILKQPDLGTALILCPIAYAMFYLGDLHPLLLRSLAFIASLSLTFILMIFLGILPIEKLRPHLEKVMKEYQIERLNPSTHHQKAAQTAIGVGGLTGSGWRSSNFTGHGWLPYAHTDSIFPAFGEEFGLVGLVILLFLFYTLIRFGFQVVASAKELFARLLAGGITLFIAMHLIINVGMMSGLLPITGVPLPLVSYGGSSIFVTMAALGLLQSIWSRRFMF